MSDKLGLTIRADDPPEPTRGSIFDAPLGVPLPQAQRMGLLFEFIKNAPAVPPEGKPIPELRSNKTIETLLEGRKQRFSVRDPDSSEERRRNRKDI